jgi:hypothetical protein
MQSIFPAPQLDLKFNISELRHYIQLTAYCPVEKQQTVSHEVKQIFLENGRGLWWHCSCCAGWHIITSWEEDKVWPEL